MLGRQEEPGIERTTTKYGHTAPYRLSCMWNLRIIIMHDKTERQRYENQPRRVEVCPGMKQEKEPGNIVESEKNLAVNEIK